MKEFATDELLAAPSASKPSLARRAVAVVLCLSVVFWSLGGGVQLLKWAWPIKEADLKPTDGPFSWNTIPTTKKISLKPCYGDYRCTRVELPLDYFNGTTDRKISLAVTVIPAKVPITDPRYGGPLLVNPGGPGGSGVDLVLEAGHAIQNMVDSPMDPTTAKVPGAKYYDIVGFDPRGVGHSSPGAHCFADGSIRESWELRLDAQGILGSSDAVLGQRWSMVNALGHNCAATANEFDVKHYVTTASVARDMLELAELFGQHRELESRRLIHHSAKCQRRQPSPTPYVYEPGAEKVQYWGFSYGTLIGSTFASMYPDRVGRLMLDGVVNGANYVKALWSDNLLDTEKEMGLFYSRCAEGGPSSCELATTSNATAAGIEAVVTDILANLYHNPLPVEHGLFPEVVTWSDVRLFMFMALYGPMEGFPAMAKMLHTLRQADASARMSEYLSSKHFYACAMPPGGGSDGGNQTQGAPVDGEALQSISCSDGEPVAVNVTDFDVFWRELDAVSPTAGAMWARHRMNCAGWKIRPVYRFEGPFGGETAEPILWIGNTADPVTPVFNAHKMASLFPGSVVLTQNSPGHASLAAYSPCTVAALRSYLHNGTLPAAGTVCEPIEIPFVKPRRSGGKKRTPWAAASSSSSSAEYQEDADELRHLLETSAAVKTTADVAGWTVDEAVRTGVNFRRVSRAWGRGRNGLGAKGLGRGLFV